MSVESIDYNLGSVADKQTEIDFSAIEKMTFRQAMSELTNTVNLLEGNTLELEQSLKQYEYGVALLNSLQKRLNCAQQQVEELMGRVEKSDLTDKETDSRLS